MTANNDGWIEWHGGECPVERGTLLDVRYANGIENIGVSARTCALDIDHIKGSAGSLTAVNWDSGLPMSGIVAYRIHQPEPKYCESVTRTIPDQPTIESLAADYRAKLAIYEKAQEELNAHRCGVEAALNALQLAGEAFCLQIEPVKNEPNEPKNEPLNITDWRDLRAGDVVQATGCDHKGWLRLKDKDLIVTHIGPNPSHIMLTPDDEQDWRMGDNTDWRFIRRPTKEANHA